MAETFPGSLVLVGAGKMGGALLGGWLRAGLPGRAVAVLDPAPSLEVAALAEAHGFALNPDRPAPPEILVLATKPQMLDASAGPVGRLAGPGTAVVSILAGKTVADLRRAAPRAGGVIRAMPNLPASIGRGATGAYADPAVSAAQRAVATTLLGCNGLVAWVEDEGLIDAVTALSGSGPAYVFHLVEAMAEAGAASGLPDDLALRLARATVTGAAALLEASPLSAAELRDDVTSKGGTTAAALEVLRGPDGLRPLMARAVAAAKRRAGELSG